MSCKVASYSGLNRLLRRGFLPWAPSCMVDVSCKGKSLLACTGGSPDIEVFDLTAMRRLVRLFGHGEWCVSICRGFATSSSTLGVAAGSVAAMEPTIFSIDRGGTLCCWQPDRSCARNVVGWIPSVQVHCVAVAFPISLAVDELSQSLLIVGIGECVAYPLDPEKKCVEREAKPPLIRLGGEDRHGVMRDVVGDESSDTPDRLRRRRHATVAASRPPLRRWDSAPSSNMELDASELRRQTEGQATGSEAMGVMGVVKGMLGQRQGLGGLKRWTRMAATMLPGAERAVIWEQGQGIYVVNLLQCKSTTVCTSDLPLTFAGDSHGWVITADEKGQLHVWSPTPIKVNPVTKSLSAHAALRERLKRVGSGGSGDEVALNGDESCLSGSPTAGMGSQGDSPKSTDKGQALERVERVERGPSRMALLSQVWSFAGSGSLERGWQGGGGGGGGGSGGCKGGKEAEQNTETWCSMVKVQGAVSTREEAREGERASGSASDVKAYWVRALKSGDVHVHRLPDGKVCARLAGHGCPVRSLLWPDSKGLLISGADDGSVKIWRVRDSSLVKTFHHQAGAIRMLTMLDPSAAAILSSKAVLCSCSEDKSVMLTTLESGADASPCRLLAVLQGHTSPVASIRWAARHGHLYVGCTDGYLHIWHLSLQQPSQLIRVIPASSAHLVLSALDRKTASMGTLVAADSGQSASARVADAGDSNDAREEATMYSLLDDDESEGEPRCAIEEVTPRFGSGCPPVLVVNADVVSVLASKGLQAGVQKGSASPGGAVTNSRQQQMQSGRPSNIATGGQNSPMTPLGGRESSAMSLVSPGSAPETPQTPESTAKRAGSIKVPKSPGSAEAGTEAYSHRSILENQNFLLSLATSAVLSMLSCPPYAPDHVKASISSALTDLGVSMFLSPECTGTFDPSGAYIAPALQASCALLGAGSALTCLVPTRSKNAGSLAISQGFTSSVSLCAAVLLDTCRALAPSNSRGAEASGELLQFVVKGLAAKMPGFCDSDVISLAKYWLLAPDSARQAAHLLLTATLGRTDANKRNIIVAEWTKKLGPGNSGGYGREAREAMGGESPVKLDGSSQFRAVMQAAANAGGGGGGGGSGGSSGSSMQTSSATTGPDGFSGKEGPALVVLAVIGSHFQEALDTGTCARVAESLVRAVSSANALHAKVASHLLSRGAKVWAPHIRNGEGLMRVLYVRYWRYSDFQSTMADTEWALRCMAPVLPSEFVEVVGEEASRHSQLVCHVRSERSVAAIKVLVALFKRNPVEMLPALPRAVEVVLRTLDPGHPLVRQALMQHSTAALKEIVRKFPMTAFHQDTQRFAVGTVDALIVIYDLRTATKWRVLEGHEGPIR